ncbi:MAG: hypothetical protein ACHP7M_12560, partial [Burkholderiales bacterium]
MKCVPVVTAFIVLLMAMPIAAKEKADPAVNASTKDAFETVSTWVRKQMDSGGRYSYVTAGERSKVNAKLDEMNRLFQKNGDTTKMTDVD